MSWSIHNTSILYPAITPSKVSLPLFTGKVVICAINAELTVKRLAGVNGCAGISDSAINQPASDTVVFIQLHLVCRYVL